MKREAWLALVLGVVILLFALVLSPVPARAGAAAAPLAQGGSGLHVYLPLIMKQAQPSSFARIERDRAAGRINDETALLYKVYATFDDPLLPAQYRSSPSPEAAWESHTIMQEVVAKWGSLSAATQEALAPLIQPPIYQGSWYDRQHFAPPASAASAANAGQAAADIPGPLPLQRPGWQSVNTLNGKAKVWWDGVHDPEQAAKAALVATLLDEVWSKETTLMGHEPLLDGGPHPFTDTAGARIVWGDGGDSRFDVYLTPCEGCGGAVTIAYPPKCKATPAYMEIDPGYAERWYSSKIDLPALQSAVAHEFMHAIQFTYDYAKPCPDYRNLEEASAEWAVDYVYPDNQEEWTRPYRFKAPDFSLFAGYSDWTFLYYVTKTVNNSVYVQAWNNTVAAGPQEAMETAMKAVGGKGFKGYWPLFAQNLWNRAPLDFFWRNDQLDLGGWGYPMQEYPPGTMPEDYDDYVQKVSLPWFGQSVKYTMPLNLPPLSIRFFHFTFPDDDVRSVSYQDNYFFTTTPDPDFEVWALYRLKGRTLWEPAIDLTKKTGKAFCRQFPDEQIDELTLVFTYSQWADPAKRFKPTLLPTLTASNIACKGWTGSVTTTHRYDVGSRTDLETEAANVTLERVPPAANDNGMIWTFRIKTGTLHWVHTGTIYNLDGTTCSIQGGPADIPLQPGDAGMPVTITGDANHIGRMSASGAVNYKTTLDQCGTVSDYYPAGWWVTGPDTTALSSDGMTVDGSYSSGTTSGWSTESVWHLQAVP